MAHYHEFYHGILALTYIERILELKKLDFRGLKCQSDVKKVNFRGLIANIGYLRSILTYRTHLWLIFMENAIEIVP